MKIRLEFVKTIESRIIVNASDQLPTMDFPKLNDDGFFLYILEKRWHLSDWVSCKSQTISIRAFKLHPCSQNFEVGPFVVDKVYFNKLFIFSKCKETGE